MQMEASEPIDHPAWPLRAALLAVLGALFGLIFWKLTDDADAWMWTENPWQMAAATFIGVGGIVFAFSLERLRWPWAVAFAVATGVVTAFVGWWNGAPQDWGSGEGWQFFASLIAVAIAVPLFQSARDAGALRFDVRAAHVHVWTNLIVAAAAGAFVIATFLLTLLLSELFHLIGIDLIRDLFNDEWFPWMLGCGALGGAVGLLRDRDKVIGLLQRVVTSILSVLAPVLALGLLVFVLALPFTGLEPLWSQTKSTTPILLVCILGAVILANAVAGNSVEEEARAPALRYAAMALLAVMLPLALVAAVSTRKRIGQYGYTPDRLWAVVFVTVATAFAAAYLYSLLRGRLAWPSLIRGNNVRLAIGVCALALFLALPIVSFGAISARDQMARLQSGRVPPERFDWAAMRFDFGPAGRKALERLAATGPATLRKLAVEALRAENRWTLAGETESTMTRIEPKLRVEPQGTKVPAELLTRIADTRQCGTIPCRLLFDTPGRAILVSLPCETCPPDAYLFFARPDGGWDGAARDIVSAPPRAAQPGPPRPSSIEGRLEVRSVEKRQLFLDGQPIGPLFAP
jgi:hypothetical protein